MKTISHFVTSFRSSDACLLLRRFLNESIFMKGDNWGIGRKTPGVRFRPVETQSTYQRRGGEV